jgi:hypothetical protein
MRSAVPALVTRKYQTSKVDSRQVHDPGLRKVLKERLCNCSLNATLWVSGILVNTAPH